jgi:hypothetical protein
MGKILCATRGGATLIVLGRPAGPTAHFDEKALQSFANGLRAETGIEVAILEGQVTRPVARQRLRKRKTRVGNGRIQPPNVKAADGRPRVPRRPFAGRVIDKPSLSWYTVTIRAGHCWKGLMWQGCSVLPGSACRSPELVRGDCLCRNCTPTSWGVQSGCGPSPAYTE